MKKAEYRRMFVIVGVASLLTAIVVIMFIVTTIIPKDKGPENTGKTKERACTTYDGSVEEQCMEDYIGLTGDEAMERAKSFRLIPQVVRVDGVSGGVLDIGGHTIYFYTEGGIVTGGCLESYGIEGICYDNS